MAVTSRERRSEILRLATTTGLASVEELAVAMGVTASTIRRDLTVLTSQGHLARTYGGAMALLRHPEASLRQRTGVAFHAKRAIGRWAAAQVKPGETILLDAGSTTGAMAHELAHAKNITVATVGLTALEELAYAKGVEVLCLGGRVRPLSQGFVGPLTEAALDRMTFDRVFMGADGVSAERGICEADLEQTRLKELMVRQSNVTYVLAHSAKLGQHPFHAWARMPQQWTLVTDGAADSTELARFRDCGISIVVVDENAPPREAASC